MHPPTSQAPEPDSERKVRCDSLKATSQLYRLPTRNLLTRLLSPLLMRDSPWAGMLPVRLQTPPYHHYALATKHLFRDHRVSSCPHSCLGTNIACHLISSSFSNLTSPKGLLQAGGEETGTFTPFRLSTLPGIAVEMPSPHKIIVVRMWLKCLRESKRGIVGYSNFHQEAKAVLEIIFLHS